MNPKKELEDVIREYEERQDFVLLPKETIKGIAQAILDWMNKQKPIQQIAQKHTTNCRDTYKTEDRGLLDLKERK